MKYILLLILIAYIKSYNSSYYSPCNNPPKGRFSYINKYECIEHKSSNGYCCHLNYYIRNANHIRKSRYEECIGITSLGYYNIRSVKFDIEKDKNLTDINIYCTSKMVDLFYISLLLFILNIN